MLYDCFSFFNEFEVLDIRLHELESCVDKFVLVESTKTHRGKEKPLYFNENKHMFKYYLDRIIHIIVDDPPGLDSGGWGLENFQRDCIMRGLEGCKSEDVILISDVDEIPRGRIVQDQLLSKLKPIPDGVFYTFEHVFYCYYLNAYIENLIWNGTFAVNYGTLSNRSPQIFRDWVRELRPRSREVELKIKNGGWHFSYLASVEKIQEKISALAHSEFDTKVINNPDYLKKCISELRSYIPGSEAIVLKAEGFSDCDLPSYVKENKDRFSNYIKSEGVSYIVAVTSDYKGCGLVDSWRKIGDSELIQIKGANSLAEAYNQGIKLAKHKIKCFIHQDVIILNDRLEEALVRYCTEDVGMVGVIGTKNSDAIPWWEGSMPGIYNNPSSDLIGGILDSELGFCIYNQQGGDCALLDGVFLATCQDIEFDERYFGFNVGKMSFYDQDICRQLLARGFKNFCLPLGHQLVVHNTGKSSFLGFEENKKLYKEKWNMKKGRILVDWPASQKIYELDLLQDFLSDKGIKRVLEIGTFFGGTTLLWAKMVEPDGRVYTADMDAHPGRQCYDTTKWKNLVVDMQGDSHDHQFKKKLYEAVGKEVDMLFVDGDHSYEGVKKDFYDYIPLVKNGGYVVFHDIIDSPAHRWQGCMVSEFWEEIKKQYEYWEFYQPDMADPSCRENIHMGIGVLKLMLKSTSLKLSLEEKPNVSIVVGTVNHLEDCLKPCLESVLKYTNLEDKEVIVVANGCTDGTREYVESLGKPFKLVWFDNPIGPGGFCNEGIKAAKGKFIIFLSNDTVLLDQKKDAWISLLKVPFEIDSTVGLTSPMRFTLDFGDFSAEAVAYWCVMIKREVFDKVGYLDATFYSSFGPFGIEDIDFSIRATRAGYRQVQVPTDVTFKFLEEKPIMNFPIWHKGSVTIDEMYRTKADIGFKMMDEKKNMELIRERYGTKSD